MIAKKKKKTPAKKSAAKGKKVAPKKKKLVAKKKPVLKKKAAAKKKAAPTKKKAVTKEKVQRRDRAGHMNPTYAKQLHARSGHTGKSDSLRPAFKVADDDVAEELGEEVVGKATSGEDEGEDAANEEYTEEVGGPFVVTTGRDEYADGVDESNPAGAEREPFPRT